GGGGRTGGRLHPPAGGAGAAAPAIGDLVEIGRPLAAGRLHPVHVPQVMEALVPSPIGPPRDRERRLVTLGHHDEAPESDPGRRRIAVSLAPALAVAVGENAR